MRMAAQYEMLTQLAKAGTKLDFGQDLFVKFYQAFIACESLKSDRIDKVRRIFCHKYMNICAAFL